VEGIAGSHWLPSVGEAGAQAVSQPPAPTIVLPTVSHI
jgi:hypothetical protein